MDYRASMGFRIGVVIVAAGAGIAFAQQASPQDDALAEAAALVKSQAELRPIVSTATHECVGVWTWERLARFDVDRVGPPVPYVVPAPKHWRRGHDLGPPRAGAIARPAPAPMRDGGVSARTTCPSLDAPAITESFLGLEDAQATIPPDTMGAVGPNHIVVMLNDRVRIQDRTGTDLGTVSLSSFWAPALPNAPFDPVVMFDPTSNRWYACVDSHRRSAASQILIAVSSTDDPTGAWSFYSIDVDATDVGWADYPRLGYNSTWIAVSNNMFTVSGNGFLGASLWVIDKASALVPGGPITVTTFQYGFDNDPVFGTFGASLTPATTHDPGEDTLWIIDSVGFTSGVAQLHRLSSITGTGPAPIWAAAPGGIFPGSGLFEVATNYSGSVPRAQQPGTSTRIATNDTRINDADFRNGTLWYSHVGGLPDAAPDRAAAFWYQVDPGADLSAPLVQSGVVDAPGVYHFFPSIAVNCADDMMIGFTRSSIGVFAESAFTYRLAADAPGTTRAVAQLKAGEDSYIKDFGSGTVRWGDYSATVVDPVDDRSMWTLQQYAATDVGGGASDDRWATWWSRLFAPTTCEGDVNGDGDTNAADFTILAGSFGSAVPPGTLGDLNGDGLVNAADFTILAGDFGCGS
jgi:hypothetical protein